MATTVTTKDRQQLVHSLSMDNIHRLKNIIYHGGHLKTAMSERLSDQRLA